MTIMGKIGVGVATAVLSAVALTVLGLGGERNTTLNINGPTESSYQTTPLPPSPQLSSFCVTTQGSCQVQPMQRGASCGCYNMYGQAFYGAVQ